ncbi:MAG: hypothetical protein J6W96_05455 [Alphaproteobacteria bacterium]|nr:hypothetical protein [Alphaproteobacteria bacterium]
MITLILIGTFASSIAGSALVWKVVNSEDDTPKEKEYDKDPIESTATSSSEWAVYL